MFDKIRDFVVTPGLVKTPSFAVAGWFTSTWPLVKGALEGLILVSTAVIVVIHLVNAVAKQWCPLRRGKVKNCEGCPLQGNVFCPRRIPDEGIV